MLRVSDGDLACVVLSLRSERGLADAVGSLVQQSEACEIVVVNSGGGDATGRLRAEGLDVPVLEEAEPLFPGAVRNLGIRGTQARYVAFLAADCMAQPGWVGARLREHRAGAAAVAGVLTNACPESRSACATFLLLHHRMGPHTPPSVRRLYGLSYDRALFDRFGTFREDLPGGEDTEFNARFGTRVPIVWTADVRTAHRNPTHSLAFLRDQYARGRRRAGVASRLGHRPQGAALAFEALGNVRASLAYAWSTPDPSERRRLLRAAPLLPLGAMSYAAGVLDGSACSGDRTASRSEPERDLREASRRTTA